MQDIVEPELGVRLWTRVVGTTLVVVKDWVITVVEIDVEAGKVTVETEVTGGKMTVLKTVYAGSVVVESTGAVNVLAFSAVVTMLI